MKRNIPLTIIMALVILIPLAFSIQTFDKFGIVKLVIYWFGCGLLLPYIFVCRGRLAGFPKTVAGAIILFLAVQTFQTLRLANPGPGLLGEYGQSESLLVQAGFMILLLAGFLFIQRDRAFREQLIAAITLAVFFVSIFGISEYYLGDLIAGTNVTRIKSFLGDPNSLGAFLILTLPLLIPNLQSPERWRRIGTGFIVYLGIIALDLTFSRAAWTGLIIIGLIMAWGISRRFFTDRVYRKKSILIAVIIGAGLVSGLILTYFQPRQHSDYSLPSRVSSVVQGNDSGRSLLWSTALTTFRHSPFIGYGLASFSISFHRFEPVAAVHFWKLDRNISQVHNEILQYLATEGLSGACAYLWLLFILFWFSNFRDLFKRSLNLQDLSLWAAVLGYLVFVQFAYPLVHYTFLVWIYLGMLLGSKYSLPESANQGPKTKLVYYRIFATATLIGIIMWGWFLINIYRADVEYRTAFFQARRNLYAASLTNYRKAFTLAPFQYQYHYRYALTLYRAAKYYGKQKNHPVLTAQYLNQAQKTAFQLLQQNPGRYQLSFLLGQIAEYRADYRAAASFYRQALSLYPNNYQFEFRLAKTELWSGNKKAALKAYQAGSGLDPGFMKDALKAEGMTAADFIR